MCREPKAVLVVDDDREILDMLTTTQRTGQRSLARGNELASVLGGPRCTVKGVSPMLELVEQPPANDPEPLSGLRHKSVLVVDDNKSVRDLICELLVATGYSAKAAGDGREALAMVGMGLPDLILLDLEMPVMSGRQFATEFHARYGTAVPIIVVSGDEDLRAQSSRLGAVDWIRKPFNASRLTKAVARQIAQP
jgi:CheY-like chemotaxis protein